MSWTFTKTLFVAAALSVPYVCSAAHLRDNDRGYAGDQVYSQEQAQQDCMRGLTAPLDTHRSTAPVSSRPMFDLAGAQRMNLFVTVRDPDGNVVRQTVCFFNTSDELIGLHTPWPDEITQWVWTY